MKNILVAVLIIASLPSISQNILAKSELEAENVDEVRIEG